MKVLLSVFALCIVSSSAFARPVVKVSVNTEVRRVDMMVETIATYQDKFWAIGLNGDTLKADGIARFFVDRDLPFQYFVRSMSGVQLGEASAYEENMKVLQDYKAKIIQEEIGEARAIKEKLSQYQQTIASPNFTGEMPPMDEFLLYFSEQRLPIHFGIESGVPNVADEESYEDNQRLIDNYMSRLTKLLESPSTVQQP